MNTHHREPAALARNAQQLCASMIRFTLLAVLMLSWLPFLAASADINEARDALPLFSSSHTLVLSISAPWRQIARDDDSQEPYPATLQYTDDNGQAQEIQLTVERRGITRQRVCKFPPIMLRFKRKNVADTVFAENKTLKMVTHCDTGRRWDQYYIKEMLAYQMYNLVTERSFRVRSLTISYHDSQRGETDEPRFAFLIEDDKLLAKRNGMKKSNAISIQPVALDSLASSRLALFQYLIGNVDWSVLSGPDNDDCCHNSKLIAPESGQPIYAVPYDFDAAGLVDAHYAAPPSGLPIRYVTQRLFRGFCVHNETLPMARAEFIALQPAIVDVIENAGNLSEGSRKRALSYLLEFFEVLADDKKFASNITAECRK